MNKWVGALITTVMLLAAVTVGQQYELRSHNISYQNEVVEAQHSIAAMRVELAATRATLDEMRVAAASATTGFEQLQNSMQLAVAESVLTFQESAKAMSEIKFATEYMRSWVISNFPTGEGK